MSQENIQSVRILAKVDLAQNWIDNETILANKEIGYERETGKYKIGDGIKTWNELTYAESESKGFDGIYDIVSDMPINDDINMMNWWTKFELLTTPGVYKINLKKPDIDSSGNDISDKYIEEALILLVSCDYIPQEGDASDEKHLTQTLISSTNIYKREGVNYIDAGSTGWGDWSQVLTNDIFTITEKQNKTDDTLTTTDKTIVGAINEINSNKQAKDFIITGTVIGDLGTGDIDVSDVSCTYEEARAAFDGGRNVKCLFYVPEMSSYTEFRYKAHSDFMIMFECMWDDYNYLPVFMANDTWDWGYSTPYRGDYVETEAMYHVAPIKVRGTIDSNNTLTLNRAQHYGQIFENAEDIQDRIVSYLNQVPIIFYVFVEEQGRFMNCYVENIIGKRNSVGTTAEVWSYDAMSFSGHIGNTVYHLDCINVRDDYTGSFAWQWSVYTAELVAKTEIETQIGDINTALETALNGGAS